ncbi:MAG: type II toxin-antitoxin system VapC family toxin [Treponema sp.]|nr:type II toxin-antitoxin system VapC family toxin [Treponema sp.]
MDYLLDTHTVLWFFNGDQESLSDIIKSAIEERQNIKYVSMTSVLEVGIKINIGKLIFPQNTNGFINQIKKNGFILLPISENHIMSLEQLPLIHRDPFDRLLIATALSEQLTLITVDENIAQYNVPQIC